MKTLEDEEIDLNFDEDTEVNPVIYESTRSNAKIENKEQYLFKLIENAKQDKEESPKISRAVNNQLGCQGTTTSLHSKAQQRNKKELTQEDLNEIFDVLAKQLRAPTLTEIQLSESVKNYSRRHHTYTSLSKEKFKAEIEKQSAQRLNECTFNPQIGHYPRERRPFSQFLRDQQKFLEKKKQVQIQNLTNREEIELNKTREAPEINYTSAKLSRQRSALSNVYDRLYTEPKKIPPETTQQLATQRKPNLKQIEKLYKNIKPQNSRTARQQIAFSFSPEIHKNPHSREKSQGSSHYQQYLKALFHTNLFPVEEVSPRIKKLHMKSGSKPQNSTCLNLRRFKSLGKIRIQNSSKVEETQTKRKLIFEETTPKKENIKPISIKKQIDRLKKPKKRNDDKLTYEIEYEKEKQECFFAPRLLKSRVLAKNKPQTNHTQKEIDRIKRATEERLKRKKMLERGEPVICKKPASVQKPAISSKKKIAPEIVQIDLGHPQNNIPSSFSHPIHLDREMQNSLASLIKYQINNQTQ